MFKNFSNKLFSFLEIMFTEKNLKIKYLYICIYLFIYLFLAALGLRCCMWAFSSCDERGLLFVAVHGLLIVVASLLEEHGL